MLEADLILHVRDIASPETQQQAEDVKKVLGELGIHAGRGPQDHRGLEQDRSRRAGAARGAEGKGGSGRAAGGAGLGGDGEGVDDLLAAIERTLMGGRPTVTVELGSDQLGAAPWLYENTEVLERSDDPETGAARLKVRVAEKRLAPFHDWAQREGVALAASERGGKSTDGSAVDRDRSRRPVRAVSKDRPEGAGNAVVRSFEAPLAEHLA